MSPWHAFIRPLTTFFRARRGALLLKAFPDIETYRVCDIGGSQHFWDCLGVNIDPSQVTIFQTSLGETASRGNGIGAAIPLVLYDGRRLPSADKMFDLVVCNSVLEHVSLELRCDLVQEMLRVSSRLFLQTPAFEFPIEPHFVFPFIHWLPRRLGYQLAKVSPWRFLSNPDVRTIREYWWGTRLLTQEELQKTLPGAVILSERVGPFVKSYCAVVGSDCIHSQSTCDSEE